MMDNHKTKKLTIDNTQIDVDVKLFNVIKHLNDQGLKTEYCCQGDQFNPGYIYFNKSITCDKLYIIEYILTLYFPSAYFVKVYYIDSWIVQICWTKKQLLWYYKFERDNIKQLIKLHKNGINKRELLTYENRYN